jgi:D-glycero-alpha-D-manno-heptose-7-phosphate kinase
LPLGGGGTDLPSYYEKYEGFLIAGAINKYLIVEANKQFYDTICLKYSKLENVNDIDEISHPLIREALRFTNVKENIEIVSLSDIPAGSGLGSSGSFLVSLLNVLHKFKGECPSRRQLAEEACHIELDILKEHEGKQDKYAASFGGIKSYTFHKNGKVTVSNLPNEDIIMEELESHLHVYFTGITRTAIASDSLKNQDIKIKENDKDVTQYLHDIKAIGYETEKAFKHWEFSRMGELMHEHWNIKTKLNPPKNKDIVRIYDYAIKHGATGGKIMGANTDIGFFAFYHPGTEKEMWAFDNAMLNQGMKRMPFKFDSEGTITLFTGE